MKQFLEMFALKCTQIRQAIDDGDDRTVEEIDGQVAPLLEAILDHQARDIGEMHLQLQFLNSCLRNNADDSASVLRYSDNLSMLLDRYLLDRAACMRFLPPALAGRVAAGPAAAPAWLPLPVEAILDSLPDCVAVIASDYRYLYSNPLNAAAMNCRPSDLVGRHLAEFIGRRRFETHAKTVLDRCFTGEHVRQEYRWRREGRSVPIRCRASPLRASGHGAMAAVVMVDEPPGLRRAAFG